MKKPSRTKRAAEAPVTCSVTIGEGGLEIAPGRILFPGGLSFKIRRGENWGICGPNGCGKTVLLQLVCGERWSADAEIALSYPGPDGDDPSRATAVVSPERQARILAAMGVYVQMRWNSTEEETTPTLDEWLSQDSVEGVLPCERVQRSPAAVARFAALRRRVEVPLRLDGLSGRRLAALSNGEMRRAVMARAILEAPKLLLLDAPFVGLDASSRELLRSAVADVAAAGSAQVLATALRPEELPLGLTHLLVLGKDGRVVSCGPMPKPQSGAAAVARSAAAATTAFTAKSVSKAAARTATGPTHWRVEGPSPDLDARVLVRMRGVTVGYGDHIVFEGLDWIVRRGERWLVSGPNGCGKTTLLALLTGDHPQAYASDVTLFGRRRGTGESIWDVKKRIGWVSPELHTAMDRTASVLESVLSGFHDGPLCLGPATPMQRRRAMAWLARLGLRGKADSDFGSLSWGVQRLVLLARAMVKEPPLLVLDEPCQNLDRENRDKFLSLVDETCAPGSGRTLLCVTHVASCVPSCVDRRLVAVSGGVKA